MVSPPHAFVPGIYVPTVTFFDTATNTIDVEATAKHAIRLAQSGVVGIVTLGSYGEGVHTSSEERKLVNSTTRSALDKSGYSHVPIISGGSDQSIEGAVLNAKEAFEAGADAMLLVPPSYYRSFITDDVIRNYFVKVADQSPLPIIIYNYPGVAAGVDLNSEMLVELAQHPNIIGTKFTCGNSGKLARVSHALDTVSETSYPATNVENGGYLIFAGMADFLTQALALGGTGVISGPGNICPKTLVRVYNLFKEGKLKEAFEAQKSLSLSDYVLTSLGPEGTKVVLQSLHGYGGHVRAPLPHITDPLKIKELNSKIKAFVEFENTL